MTNNKSAVSFHSQPKGRASHSTLLMGIVVTIFNQHEGPWSLVGRLNRLVPFSHIEVGLDVSPYNSNIPFIKQQRGGGLQVITDIYVQGAGTKFTNPLFADCEGLLDHQVIAERLKHGEMGLISMTFGPNVLGRQLRNGSPATR